MQFPSEVQAALLFDERVDKLDAIVRDFARIEAAKTGGQFNVPEAKPGIFYRLFGGGDELMVTLEYVDRPCDVGVFSQALGSAVTGILCPDLRERLTRNRSHILVNVSHGAMGGVLNSPDIARFLSQIDYKVEGQSLPQFQRRLDVCALIARITCDRAPVQAVHWCQSNQIYPADKFDAVAGATAPSPLHIHPYLFGGETAECGETKLGIRTFGAQHFIGREIMVQPNVIPWAANYETILSFLRIATVEKGYIIPDGDTFGPEDRSLSYRCIHRDAEDGDVPLYELVPLMYREFNFQAEDFVPHGQAINDRSPPAELMPEDDEAKMELANEWREKRKLAEGLGGRFEVRHRDAPGGPAPAGPGGGAATPGGLGSRPVFGRKKA